MKVGALRSLTTHAPSGAEVRLKLPDGRIVAVVGSLLEYVTVTNAKITEWPVALVLTTQEEPTCPLPKS